VEEEKEEEVKEEEKEEEEMEEEKEEEEKENKKEKKEENEKNEEEKEKKEEEEEEKITYSECVCSLRYQACKTNALYYTATYDLSVSTKFLHIVHLRHDFRGGGGGY
jgi:hypothetical protein